MRDRRLVFRVSKVDCVRSDKTSRLSERATATQRSIGVGQRLLPVYCEGQAEAADDRDESVTKPTIKAIMDKVRMQSGRMWFEMASAPEAAKSLWRLWAEGSDSAVALSVDSVLCNLGTLEP